MSQNWGNKRRENPHAGKAGRTGHKTRSVRSGGMTARSRQEGPGKNRTENRKSPGKGRSPPTTRGAGPAGDRKNLMQELKPTVWIGKLGLTETIIAEVVAQLKNRKAVKVKWLQNTDVSPEELAKSTGARLIGVRGRTLVLEERRRL
jgi:RNA-binding protein